jgi:hypothetical protein
MDRVLRELQQEMVRWEPAIFAGKLTVEFAQAELETRQLAPLIREMRLATDDEEKWRAVLAVEAELERVRAARKVQQ